MARERQTSQKGRSRGPATCRLASTRSANVLAVDVDSSSANGRDGSGAPEISRTSFRLSALACRRFAEGRQRGRAMPQRVFLTEGRARGARPNGCSGLGGVRFGRIDIVEDSFGDQPGIVADPHFDAFGDLWTGLQERLGVFAPLTQARAVEGKQGARLPHNAPLTHED